MMVANMTKIDGRQFLIIFVKGAAQPALYKVDIRNSDDFFKNALVTASFKDDSIFGPAYSQYCIVNGKIIVFDLNKRDSEPFFFLDIEEQVKKTVIDLKAYGELNSVDNLKCLDSAKEVHLIATFRQPNNTYTKAKIVINADNSTQGSDRIHSVT